MRGPAARNLVNVRQSRVFPALTAVLLGLSACGSTGTPDPATTGSPTGTDPASVRPQEGGSATPSAQAAPSSITLAFAGDVHFERQVAGLLDQSDEAWAVKLPELRDADFAMVNLETALGTAGSPAPKSYTFQAPASALDKLRTAGVDAVSMANNHAVDHGRAGLADTLDILQRGTLPVVGLGSNEQEAFAPLLVDIGGVDTAIIASSHIEEWTSQNWAASGTSAGIATDLDPTRLRAAVRAAAKERDLVVVFLHWGIEGSNCPSERQIERVAQLSEDGADIIVGTHAHRLQANGWKGRVFVGYGLGNFVWYNSAPDSRPSGVLAVTVDADAARARGEAGTPTSTPLVTDFTWEPKLIAGDGEPMSVEGNARASVEGRMEQAIACADLQSSPS